MYRKQDENCFVSTQRILMDLPLTISELPRIGTGTFAKASSIIVGAGYTILSAVSRQGIRSCCASPLGTGPNSKQIKEAFRLEKIECLVEEVIGDNGLKLNLRDEKGNYTYIVSSGVEAEPQLSELLDLDLQKGDYVFISGMDLSNENSAKVILQWCKYLNPDVKIVFSPGPFVDNIPSEVISEIFKVTDVLTINKREIKTIFSAELGADENTVLTDDLMWDLLGKTVKDEALIVVRDGVFDCQVKAKNTSSKVMLIPCFKNTIMDMAGVADTHTGVLVASLMSNYGVYESVRRANLAASISASKIGYNHCPSAIEIDIYLKDEM